VLGLSAIEVTGYAVAVLVAVPILQGAIPELVDWMRHVFVLVCVEPWRSGALKESDGLLFLGHAIMLGYLFLAGSLIVGWVVGSWVGVGVGAAVGGLSKVGIDSAARRRLRRSAAAGGWGENA
jgi:hypothetical protein